MKCQCPACGRKMRLQQDMLDFLVRCDRCKTYLLPRSAAEPESALAPAAASLQILPLGAVGDRPASGGLHLDRLLTRPPGIRRPTPIASREIPPTLAEMARERQLGQAFPTAFSSRHSASRAKQTSIRGTVILWTLLTAAVVAALVLAAHHWMLRPAFARESGASVSNSLALRSDRTVRDSGSIANRYVSPGDDSQAKVAKESPSASADRSTGSGELFPNISPTR